jgi:hypothetical protein
VGDIGHDDAVDPAMISSFFSVDQSRRRSTPVITSTHGSRGRQDQ